MKTCNNCNEYSETQTYAVNDASVGVDSVVLDGKYALSVAYEDLGIIVSLSSTQNWSGESFRIYLYPMGANELGVEYRNEEDQGLPSKCLHSVGRRRTVVDTTKRRRQEL